MATTYDRNKAINYAQAYWSKPCEDGLIGFEDEHAKLSELRKEKHAPEKEWDALFVRNPGDGNSEKGVFRKKGPPGPLMAKDLIFREGDITFAVFHPQLNDCAHYLSQCFIKGGPGFQLIFSASEAWSMVCNTILTPKR